MSIGNVKTKTRPRIGQPFHFRDSIGLEWPFRNGFALVKLFNAIPLPPFSAVLSIFAPIFSSSVPVLAHNSYPLAKSCRVQQCRLTVSDSLEERKDWLKLQGRFNHPKKPGYHRNRNAYTGRDNLEKERAKV